MQQKSDILVTTTSNVEGRSIAEYLGVFTGEAVMAFNILKEFTVGIKEDIIGGRAGSYEKQLRTARDNAYKALLAGAKQAGADAIIGFSIDYEYIGGASKSMLMAVAIGTAVRLGPPNS